jgi:hypothetical protein
LEDTMASFSPINALRRVLFPALGFPNMLTNPDFTLFNLLTGKNRLLKLFGSKDVGLYICNPHREVEQR